MNAEPKQSDAFPSDSCPLCGGPNQCGVAAGRSKCWCFTAEISQEAKAKIPEEARGVACICQYCAEGKKSPAAVKKAIKRLTTR